MRPNKSFSLQLFYRQSTSSERAFVLLIKCQARGCCPNFWQIHVTLRFKSKAGRIGIRDGWSCHWKNQRRLMFQTVADERGSVSSTKRKFLFSLLWSGNTDSWCWSGRKMADMGNLIYLARICHHSTCMFSGKLTMMMKFLISLQLFSQVAFL